MSISTFALALLLSGTPGPAEAVAIGSVNLTQSAPVVAAPLQERGAVTALAPAAESPLQSSSDNVGLTPDQPKSDQLTSEVPANPAPVGAAAVTSDTTVVAPSSGDSGESAVSDGPVGTDVTVAEAPSADEEINEIIVVARKRSPIDPLEGLNVKSYEVVQSLDRAFVGPMAMTYKENVPRPIRSGLRNFLRNLTEPVVFLNYLLQFKLGKAAETAGRFAINSTLGVAGLFDTAKKEPFNLPYRNNGFGYTLGFYGVKSGPFLYLPFIGPTTLRDVSGSILDMMVMPFAIGAPFNDPFYALPTTTLRLLDERAESDVEEDERIANSGDPYGAMRDAYLKRRQAEIDALRGKKPAAQDGLEDKPMPAIEPVVLPDLYEIVPVDVTEEAMLPPPSIVLPDVMAPAM